MFFSVIYFLLFISEAKVEGIVSWMHIKSFFCFYFYFC